METASALPFAFILAIVLSGAGLLWLAMPRRAPLHAGPAEALQVSRLFLELLRHMQQHRGMSSAWLAGDRSFAARIETRRDEIERVLAQLARALEAEQRRPCPNPDRASYDAFRRHWQELAAGLAQCSAEQSIARHGTLIATLLDWLSAYGEVRLGAGSLAQARNVTHRLPALTEALGQARAIGSSVAARGACSPVPRVRLTFLAARAEALVEQAGATACEGRVRQAREEARASIAQMTRMIRADLLKSAGMDVPADTWFALATRSIDAVFGWIDACAEDIARQPADRRSAHPAAPPVAPGRHRGLLSS